MSWRPEDWKNPYFKKDTTGSWNEYPNFDIFEAGADAMLEALKKNSVPYDAFKETAIMSLTKGRVVFIHDKEREDELE